MPLSDEDYARYQQARPGYYAQGFDPYTNNAIRQATRHWDDYVVGRDGHIYHRGAAASVDPEATEAWRRKRIDEFLATDPGRRLFYEQSGASALERRQADIDRLRGQIDPTTQSYYQQMQRQIESMYAKAGEQQMARAAARSGGSIQTGQLRQLGNEQRAAYSAERANAAAEAQRYSAALTGEVAGLQGGQADAYLAYTGGGVLQQQGFAENQRQFNAAQELERSRMYGEGVGNLFSGGVQTGLDLYTGHQYREALEEGLRGRPRIR